MPELTDFADGAAEGEQRSQFSPEASIKTVYTGTHRVCPPEITLARVQPFLSSMGITRVADVTHLDDLGLPVFQAVRPNARTLSVSQGKGITKALAKVSALMESIEVWHAEEAVLPSLWSPIGEMARQLPYSVYDLNLDKHHLLHEGFQLEWFPARIIGSSDETWVPAEYIRLDMRVKKRWRVPTFRFSSNGLASGNTLEEAILHGLYEVIERDTLTQARAGVLSRMSIDPTTVDGTASASLLERLWKAEATVEIVGMVGATGITCFEARLFSPSYPKVIPGYGCHLDRDVALSRALTEAAQVRLSVISGARDDIQHGAYRDIHQRHPLARPGERQPDAIFHDMPSLEHRDLAADLHEVTHRLRSVVPCPPLFVDLTRKELNIPVVFVVVPRLRMVEGD